MAQADKTDTLVWRGVCEGQVCGRLLVSQPFKWLLCYEDTRSFSRLQTEKYNIVCEMKMTEKLVF